MILFQGLTDHFHGCNGAFSANLLTDAQTWQSLTLSSMSESNLATNDALLLKPSWDRSHDAPDLNQETILVHLRNRTLNPTAFNIGQQKVLCCMKSRVVKRDLLWRRAIGASWNHTHELKNNWTNGSCLRAVISSSYQKFIHMTNHKHFSLSSVSTKIRVHAAFSQLLVWEHPFWVLTRWPSAYNLWSVWIATHIDMNGTFSPLTQLRACLFKPVSS